MVRFKAGERKAEVMAPYLQAAAAAGQSEVVAVGCAREFQSVQSARRREAPGGRVPAVHHSCAVIEAAERGLEDELSRDFPERRGTWLTLSSTAT